MRSLPFACLLLTAAVLGCDSGPTRPADTPDRPSLAVIVNEQTRDFSGVSVINECTGEVLPATGTFHTLTAVTADGAGGFHENVHMNLHLTATSGTTGARYLSNTTGDFALNEKAGVEQKFLLSLTLIGHGGVPNAVLTVLIHITVRPDGTVISFFDNVRLHCQ